MLSDSIFHRQRLDSEKENRRSWLRQILCLINNQLAEAFVHARLIEPWIDEPDTPLEPREVQA
ncbi:hypothetical protein BAUCODRAFT_28943 [Baudoinia panamericana UAMH 10762]|uniref:Uncharacterized protein n=1 Tax=Baudoinia panamericana (strain UAMH 10762) TaxID=717646 RepID=M2NM64_BAUPA|nr:uncharacterized protein BAUCODRAFT_28943 [Baudoinia panamericana UAMH 10762]EMD00590.1 hypothetical protein BAUCODRAFT_28943 [Baudoinia panamericana UAMH 10762]